MYSFFTFTSLLTQCLLLLLNSNDVTAYTCMNHIALNCNKHSNFTTPTFQVTFLLTKYDSLWNLVTYNKLDSCINIFYFPFISTSRSSVTCCSGLHETTADETVQLILYLSQADSDSNMKRLAHFRFITVTFLQSANAI
jgi:hypothetical protein